MSIKYFFIICLLLSSCNDHELSELQKTNGDLTKEVSSLQKALETAEAKNKQFVLKIDWDSEFDKMKALDLATLKNNTGDFNKNRQSHERAADMMIQKRFETICRIGQTSEHATRGDLEDEYLKALYLYKLSEVKRRIREEK